MPTDPAKRLDADLLKKTAGLLAEIDRVAAAPTTAERVSRVIESAAPDRRYDTFDSFEAWDWQRSGYSYLVEDAERLHAERHMPEKCGCPVVDAVIWGEDGEDGPREVKALDCETDCAPRDDPIFWTKPPYYHDTHGPSTHSVQKPCGAKGCACKGLWDLPVRVEWDLTWQPGRTYSRPRDQSITCAVYDEARTFDGEQYVALIEERIRAQFAELSIPRSMLDITGVD